MVDYRQVGGRIGLYIRTRNPTTQQIQALISDLLAGDDLLLPMRDVIARPWFSALQDLAGSGRGCVPRDAGLQELAKSYLPQVVENVRQLLNGMLDQPASKTTYTTDLKSDQPRPETPQQEKVILGQSSINRWNEKQYVSEERQRYLDDEIGQLASRKGRDGSRSAGIHSRTKGPKRYTRQEYQEKTWMNPVIASAIALVYPGSIIYYALVRRSWKLFLYPCVVVIGFFYPSSNGSWVIAAEFMFVPKGLGPYTGLGAIALRACFAAAFYIAASQPRRD